MANDIAIKVNNVSKIYNLYETNTDRALGMLGFRHGIKYREHHALKDVSFEVKKGDCVGIIGTNGAGKSTMLKIITGVLSPTSGTVDISDCTRVVYSAGLWNGYRSASGSYTIKGKIQSWD